MSRRLWNPWHALRHDIGRKCTALALALLVWGALEHYLVDERRVELDVRVVSSLKEAQGERLTYGDAVYLIVPDDLIVISKDPSVRLKVKGLADDVNELALSAFLEFDRSRVGDADETTVSTPLERQTFKSRDKNPQLTDFKVAPDVLNVTLARRETLEDVPLTPANVVPEGKPRDGYVFAGGEIKIVPNTVRLTGPRSVLKPLAADPSLLRLEPIHVEGKSATVVKGVGLSAALLARGVTMLPAPGTVTVSIPIVPEDITVPLLYVPIEYAHEDALRDGGRRVASKTDTLDLKLIGPSSELSALSPEQLGKMLKLGFDWRSVKSTVMQERPRVTIWRNGLSENVRVLSPDDEEPRIEFSLEPVP